MNTSIFILLVLLQFGCGKNEEASGMNSIDIAGTWEISKFTYSKDYDLNGDHTASKDFLKERTCYKFTVNFTKDGKYTLKKTPIDLEHQVETCLTQTDETGVYSIVANIVNLFDGTTLLDILSSKKREMTFLIENEKLLIKDGEVTGVLGARVRELLKK